MNIINAFYGALLSIWVVISIQKPIEDGKWICLLALAFGLVTIYGLYEVSTFPRVRARIPYLLSVVGSSVATSFFAQNASGQYVIWSPQFWFLTFTVIIWFLSFELARRGGQNVQF